MTETQYITNLKI